MIRASTSSVSSKISRIKFPEKFKGTIVEKWADYWKNLFIDYRQMLVDLRSDIQDEPVKAFKWITGMSASYFLYQSNPNELEFKNELKGKANEMSLVSDACLNPKAIAHIRYLDTCYNEGIIKYQSLGLISFMYVTDFNDECSLYKSQCSYMKPTYFNLISQIVDVGIADRWWNLYIKTVNFDVNN